MGRRRRGRCCTGSAGRGSTTAGSDSPKTSSRRWRSSRLWAGVRRRARDAAAPVVVGRPGARVLGRRRLRLGRLRVPGHRPARCVVRRLCSISRATRCSRRACSRWRGRAGATTLRDGFLDGSIFAVAAAVAVWQLLVVPTAAGTHSLATARRLERVSARRRVVARRRRLARARTREARRCRRSCSSARSSARSCSTSCTRTFRSSRRSTSTRLDLLVSGHLHDVAAAALHPECDELTTAGPAERADASGPTAAARVVARRSRRSSLILTDTDSRDDALGARRALGAAERGGRAALRAGGARA